MSFSLAGNAMDVLRDIVVSVGRGIEQVLVYVETHHWIFGFLVIGYVFYLHDRALHARFDALDKRIDEIRKRLAVEYRGIADLNRIRRLRRTARARAFALPLKSTGLRSWRH